MAQKFKVGDPAFIWEENNYWTQIEGTVVHVFPRGTLGPLQESVMVVIAQNSKVNPIFHIREEAMAHKAVGVHYGDDPDNQHIFAKFREETNKNTIQRNSPKL